MSVKNSDARDLSEFLTETDRVRRELWYLTSAIESQQSNVRVASGVTGFLAIIGTGVSFVAPPFGVGMFALGASTYIGTKVADGVMNKGNDNRLRPLVDLQYEEKIAHFLQKYGINGIDTAELRNIRDKNVFGITDLGSELFQLTYYVQRFESFKKDFEKFKEHRL